VTKLKEFRNEGQDGRSVQFRGIQILRGLAACMVVVHHATQMWSQSVTRITGLPVWWTGAAGVDIFFVISGFVMAVSTIGREHKTHPARSFLERRIIRIFPLYWIVSAVLLLKVAALEWHPQLAGSSPHVHVTFSYLLASFLLIPYRDSLGNILPLLIAGWTLSYEMFFYLLFSIALALRVRVAYFLTPVMLAFVLAGMFRGAHWPAILVLTDPILLEFLVGLLLGHFVIQGFRIHWAISALLAIVAVILLLILPQTVAPSMRLLQWGVPATLLVLSFVMLEERVGTAWPRWALLLGDASYSLYLSHLLVLFVLVKVLLRFVILSSNAAHPLVKISVVLILLCGCVLSSLPLYRVVEKPLNKKLRRRLLAEGSAVPQNV
jgi:peptidoglycan/LPS O-acetylase OafA/YrhL